MAPGEEKIERYIDLIMVLNSLRIPSGGAAGGGARSCSCFCGRNQLPAPKISVVLLTTVNCHCCVQVVELLAAEKGWGWWRRRKELARALDFLQTFKATPATPGGVPSGGPPPEEVAEAEHATVAAGGSSGK